MKTKRVTVGVVLINSSGEVLMQLRDDRKDITDPGLWVVPGGGLDPGETLEDGAKREFFEETGYRVKDLVFVHSDSLERPNGALEERYFFWSWYDGIQPIHCYEGQDVRFMSASELLDVQMSTGLKQVILRVMQKIASSLPYQ